VLSKQQKNPRSLNNQYEVPNINIKKSVVRSLHCHRNVVKKTL